MSVHPSTSHPRRRSFGRTATLTILLSVFLAACGGSSGDTAPAPAPAAPAAPTTPEPAPADGPVLKVGILTDLTSIFSIYGIPNARAVELGFEYATNGTMVVAGRPIEIVSRDDQNNPDTGVAAARELIEREGVSLLIGTMSSGVAAPVMELVDGSDVIYLPVAAAAEVTSDWFTPNAFRFGRNIQIDANAMVRYQESLTPDARWAVLVPNYALGTSALNAFRRSMDESSMTIADGGEVLAPPPTTDFTPFLQQIMNTNATHLAMFWVADQTALYQQMEDIGLRDKMEVIGVLANDPLIPQVYSPGDIGTTPYRWHVIDTPANNWFVEQYVARYGEPPNVISGPAFSAAVAYVRALESTGGDASAAAMIKALETIEFDSVYGPARFRACDHAGLHPYYIIAADNLGSTDGKFSRLVARIEAEDAAIPCGVPGR